MRKIFSIIVHFVHGQPIAVPLGFRENGMPYINGTVPSLLGNSVVSFNLKAGFENRLWLANSNDDDFDFENSFLEINITQAYPVATIINPRVSIVTPVDATALSVDMVRKADIGFDRSSYLVQVFSPINILRNRDLILLRATDLDEFLGNCEPETQFTLPFIPQAGGVSGDLMLTIDLGDGIINDYIGVIGNRASESIIEINRRQYQAILGIIGGPNLTPENRVLGCAQVRTRLPTISIAIQDLSYSNSLGHVVLYPEDYTNLDTDGSCTLLVGEVPGGQDIAYLNPLMIPNVNVRFTSDYMIMCDSLDG